VVDLSGRHELEHRMATALAAHAGLVLLKRATTSMTELDYAIAGPGDRLAQVELKPKHQSYRGWVQFRPELAEGDLFILDELSLRKIVGAGRYAYLVVADIPGGALVRVVRSGPGAREQGTYRACPGHAAPPGKSQGPIGPQGICRQGGQRA
jgi:hypothetical protein